MNPLDKLKELDLQARRKRYPSAPPHAITRGKFSDRSANALTQAVLKWLELHGHWATRVNSQGRKLKDTVFTNVIGQTKTIPGKWIPGTTRNGTADIHSVIGGKHVSIEVKIGADRMSAAQQATKAAIEKAGGVYLVVGNFQGFHDWYIQTAENQRKASSYQDHCAALINHLQGHGIHVCGAEVREVINIGIDEFLRRRGVMVGDEDLTTLHLICHELKPRR